MRRPTSRFHKGASGVLIGLAIAAVAFLAGGSTAQAQAKSWEKIKSPPLPEFKVPSPERYTMPNGITVLMLEDHELPLIEMDVRIKTGSRLEPSDMTGLAEVMGDVMRSGGAGSRNGDEIDEYLESRGAVIDSSVSDTSGEVTMSCLKNDFPDIVKVVSDILRDPKFDQKKIDVSKNQMKAAVARRNDNPAGVTFREGQRLVYGPDSAYGRLVEYATLDKFHRDDLMAFHAKYYVPNRVYIGVTGDFDSASMKKTLDGVFGDWKKGPDVKDQLPAVQASAKPGIYWVHKDDVTQSNIFMGELGIERNDPDYYASRVMNEILSGSFASRLFNNIRTVKGLAYSVRGSLGANYDYPGIFSMSMSTKTETTAASIDALLEEVDRLTSAPPTAEEMERAREGLLNSFIFNFDTNQKIMAQQLTLAYYGYPSDFLEKFRDHIEKVTADDIFQLAKKRVHKDQLAILVVGKSEGMDRPLASFGKVNEIDVSIPEPAASATASRQTGGSP